MNSPCTGLRCLPAPPGSCRSGRTNRCLRISSHLNQLSGIYRRIYTGSNTSIWAPGLIPLPPKPKASGTRGRAPTRHRFAKGNEPQSCEQVALSVDEHSHGRQGTEAVALHSMNRTRQAGRSCALADSGGSCQSHTHYLTLTRSA